MFLFDPRRRRYTGLTRIDGWPPSLIVGCDDHFLPSVYISLSVSFFYSFCFWSRGSCTVIAVVAVIMVALELEISLTESLSADFNSSSKSDITSNESAKSNEIEESIPHSGLTFTTKPFLLFTKSLSSMKRTSTRRGNADVLGNRLPTPKIILVKFTYPSQRPKTLSLSALMFSWNQTMSLLQALPPPPTPSVHADFAPDFPYSHAPSSACHAG